MAHTAQINYCILVKSLFPSLFKNRRVLDIGSMDINGNNRYLFNGGEYLGVDIGPGKNVDYICLAHRLPFKPGSFNTIISTEVAEHDKHYADTMRNAIRMLEAGGLLLFTCATTGRAEHGTRRTDIGSSPYTTDYYQNVTEKMLRAIPGFTDAWDYHRFTIDHQNHDLQFFGIKKGGEIAFRPNVFILIKLHLIQFFFKRVKDYMNFVKRIIR